MRRNEISQAVTAAAKRQDKAFLSELLQTLREKKLPEGVTNRQLSMHLEDAERELTATTREDYSEFLRELAFESAGERLLAAIGCLEIEEDIEPPPPERFAQLRRR